MHQLSALRNRLPELRNLFASERSLLLPMVVLALGIHAAVLTLPIPAKETLKTPDDQKNPIKVTQIPTESPLEAMTSTGVKIPPLGTSVSNSSEVGNSSDASDSEEAGSTSDSSDSDTDASPSTDSSADSATSFGKSAIAASPVKKATKSVSAKAAATPTDSDASTTEQSSSSSPGETAETVEPSSDADANVSPSATVSRGGVSATAFANFPQFQSSTGDCFGLGLGDNCRVVENGAIAEVTKYFRKELGEKQFKADLVRDEPSRKVFRVSKDNKTLFLNILQNKQNVVHVLSSVVYKQSPDEVTEKGE
ncbi:hypothetical protein JOY44_12345 [Phormidium sp. CLA17]|uniref:hypothetical protein n=1 Tax=Leptolyngbya sp. Cla-17 TaxID=2803751 RepID=UPI0019328598|nr:hypothetical protein [Leptolyngbya sp. Cla-17]MBM0742398.1 hypothetical protein [Leptolyngbya sp. Cla-17]